MKADTILDLFCGAGGCARGYQRAGFYVVGVDNRPQPRYAGDVFFEGDALAVMRCLLDGNTFGGGRGLGSFDVIHASPPCQAYTHARWIGNRGKDDHPRLIAPVRDLLEQTGLPYVIENVEDARAELRDPSVICGTSLGLAVKRHRLFESNVPLLVPPCACGNWQERRYVGTPRADGSQPLSRFVNQMASGTTHEALAAAMGVDWMDAPGRKRPSVELCEAIPPAYTELIGHQLLAHVRTRTAA